MASRSRSVISRTSSTQLRTGAIKCKYRTLKDFTLHTPTQQAAWYREKYKEKMANQFQECYASQD